MAKRRTVNQQIYDDIVDYLVSQGVSLEEIPDAPPRITQAFLEEMMRFRQEIDQMAKEAVAYREHLEGIVRTSPDFFEFGDKALYLYDETERGQGSVQMIAKIKQNVISKELVKALEKAVYHSKQPEAYDGYSHFLALLDSIEDTTLDTFFIRDDSINSSPEDEVASGGEYDGEGEYDE